MVKKLNMNVRIVKRHLNTLLLGQENIVHINVLMKEENILSLNQNMRIHLEDFGNVEALLKHVKNVVMMNAKIFLAFII
jgi:hypothetical protein